MLEVEVPQVSAAIAPNGQAVNLSLASMGYQRGSCVPNQVKMAPT